MIAVVTDVLDGDTFDIIAPGWSWNGQQGTRIRPAGYDAPEIGTLGGTIALNRLKNMIKGQVVKLGNAYRVDRGRLVCEVFFYGRNLAEYFK